MFKISKTENIISFYLEYLDLISNSKILIFHLKVLWMNFDSKVFNLKFLLNTFQFQNFISFQPTCFNKISILCLFFFHKTTKKNKNAKPHKININNETIRTKKEAKKIEIGIYMWLHFRSVDQTITKCQLSAWRIE